MSADKIKYPSWDEMLEMKSGTILRDWFEDGIRCIIMRGPASICAYMGVPAGHPLANMDCESIPLNVHGGLTFSGGSDTYRPSGYYYYGWDYSHCGDYSFYYDSPTLNTFNHSDDKKWLGEEVEQEVKYASWDFKKLMNIAEKSANK